MEKNYLKNVKQEEFLKKAHTLFFDIKSRHDGPWVNFVLSNYNVLNLTKTLEFLDTKMHFEYLINGPKVFAGVL